MKKKKKKKPSNSNIHICNPLIQLQLEYDRFLVPLRHESKKMPEKLQNKLIGISVGSKYITGKQIDIYVGTILLLMLKSKAMQDRK